MGEIEIGEYVRTRGKIGKLIRVERDDIDISLKWYVLDDGKYERYVNKPYIEKHSKNIIDLIEVGDYVNGYKITNKIELLHNKVRLESGIYAIDGDIKSIVTHEQFASMEYKVGE